MKEVLLEKLSHVLPIGSGRDRVNPALWLHACALHPVLTAVGERQGRGLHTSPVFGVDLSDVLRGISAGEGPNTALKHPTVHGGAVQENGRAAGRAYVFTSEFLSAGFSIFPK